MNPLTCRGLAAHEGWYFGYHDRVCLAEGAWINVSPEKMVVNGG